METVFVYGTLKQGLRNHGLNRGLRWPGRFETVERLPLYIVGDRKLPWLLDRPGQGDRVIGELYDCDADAMAALDALEQITEPHWYERRQVMVSAVDSGFVGAAVRADPVTAWVYFGSESGFARATGRQGPIREYVNDWPVARCQ